MHMAPLEIKEPTFIAEDKIPMKVSNRAEEWIAFLKKIPRGQALVTTRKELGVTVSSMKITIDRLTRKGQLPPTYYVRQRTTKEGTVVYIVNSNRALRKHKKAESEPLSNV